MHKNFLKYNFFHLNAASLLPKLINFAILHYWRLESKIIDGKVIFESINLGISEFKCLNFYKVLQNL